MVNAEKFYQKLIDRLSVEVREALSEQDKAFHRETEVIGLLHDKTMPYGDYIKLQKELETLQQIQNNACFTKDAFVCAREIVFDTYKEMKRGKNNG